MQTKCTEKMIKFSIKLKTAESNTGAGDQWGCLGAKPPAAGGLGSGGKPPGRRKQGWEPPALGDFSTKITHF